MTVRGSWCSSMQTDRQTSVGKFQKLGPPDLGAVCFEKCQRTDSHPGTTVPEMFTPLRPTF